MQFFRYDIQRWFTTNNIEEENIHTMKTIKALVIGLMVIVSFDVRSVNAHAEEIKHVVTSSDTLSKISEKYFGSTDFVDKIAKDNQIDNPNLIFDGQVLKIETQESEGGIKLIRHNKVIIDQTPKETKAEETVQEKQVADSQNTPDEVTGKVLYMESTAYSSDPRDSLGGGTVTATGQNLLTNPMAVAVDPNVIPLGTRLYVEGYGEAIASDTGGAIKGNIIDVHFSTYEQCIRWGRRIVKVTILD